MRWLRSTNRGPVPGATGAPRRGGAFVPFVDEALVKDVDLPDHEQAQVRDQGPRDGLVAGVIAVHIHAEALSLHAAAVEELDPEVENDAALDAVFTSHGGRLSRRRSAGQPLSAAHRSAADS